MIETTLLPEAVLSREAADPDEAPRPQTPPVDRRPAWRRLLGFLARRPGLVLSLLFLGAVLVAAFVPGLLTSQSATVGVPAHKLRGPSPQHWFGTDQLGRDLYARVVHGASLSLQAILVAVGLALVVGSLVGLLAGFVSGWFDDALMRLVDVLLAIPQLLLSLTVITALGFGTVNVALAVGIATMARFARVMRAEVLRVRHATFVEAAHACGVRRRSILARHVLPNAAGPVAVLGTVSFGTATLAVSALSFLGYGEPPPAPEWGSLVAGGRSYLASAWWLTTFPGIVVAATVLAATRVARALEAQREGAR